MEYIMMRIGYLGPEGTFSQEALEKYAYGLEHEACKYATIPEILYDVQKGIIDEAVVPIENSLEGAVNATLDMMAFEVDLKIKGELVIPVRQNILVKKGTQHKDIRCILSHPQPIGQCRKYLEKRFPGVEIRPVLSTAAAAEKTGASSGDIAAIGSLIATKIYGLDVLEYDIHDEENNVTRFVIVSPKHTQRTGADKTSIVFSTEDRPGSLYRVLDIFNLWDVNMSKIESRPVKKNLGRYIFVVDIIGHIDDEDVRDALTMVRRKTSFFKLLGSYPRCDF
jgi:prephenate dehydratase